MADEMATSALSGAAMGASAGAAAGPYGALIGGVVGLGYGLYTGDKAEKAAKNRPKYQIPPEILQNLTQADQQALVGLPEQVVQDYVNKVDRSTAYSLNALSDRKTGIGGVAALDQNQKDAMFKLAGADATAKQENTKILYNMRGQLADQKTMQFQVNQLNPYYEERAQQNAQEGATARNLANTGAALGYGYSQRNQPVANQQQSAINPYTNPYAIPSTGQTNYNPNSIEYSRNNGLYDNMNTGYNPLTGTYTG